jgi:hypothetical protein
VHDLAPVNDDAQTEAPLARAGLLGRLTSIGRSAGFAYATVFLIQLKVVWGIWDHRDLQIGDTAKYFYAASAWHHHLDLAPIFSPGYTAFWGSLMWLIHGTYAVTITHRLLIVLCLTLLVLAVLRRLLPAGIAWALAVWWAILPTNFDEIYEVHLFAAIPMLAAALVASIWKGRKMRCAVFTILVADAALVRNEVAIAAALWGIGWIAYEVRQRRLGARVDWRRVAVSLVGPVVAVAIVFGAIVLHWSNSKNYRHELSRKHTLNVCQVYAYGYEQHHNDFRGNWTTQCQLLMQRDFGRPFPSLAQAIDANPGAMANFFLWNVHLVPYGIEDMLFNHISSDKRHSPDYIAVKSGSAWAAAGVIAVFLLILTGGSLLWRDRRRWWEEWIRKRAATWLVLLAFVPVAVVIILTQRPRPSYLFPLTVLILAMLGTAVQVIGSRWRNAGSLYAILPLAAIAVLLLVPPYYTSHYVTPKEPKPGRPLETAVARLDPYRPQLEGKKNGLLAVDAKYVCYYLAGDRHCRPVEMATFGTLPGGQTPPAYLDQRHVNFIYADQETLANPLLSARIRGLEGHGWSRIAPTTAGESGWLLLGRAPLAARGHP